MHDVKRIALTFMEGLQCARSLSIAICLRYDAYAEIAGMAILPDHYLNAEDYFKAVAATCFLKKLEGMPTGIDTAQAALDKWYEAERMCYRTNQRLTSLYSSGFPTDEERRLREFFAEVRKNVAHLIGSRPPDTWEGAFGPGSTVTDSSQRSLVPDKLLSAPSLTQDAWPFLLPWMGTRWATVTAHLGQETTYVRGNHYFTVPKDSRTQRSCAKEPSLNIFFQKGLGLIMRKRLRPRGIDLEYGPDIHKRVACSASKAGDLATVDLSSASDTVSHALVRCAFPRHWVEALESLRSPYTKVKGKWHLLEKFSSMGNGFTFELETVLFTALIMSLSPGLTPGVDFWVYGDDIIVPSSLEAELKSCFAYCGFKLNEEKSFFTGKFRESCGGDFFDGQAVRPYYLKEVPNEPQQYIALANGLRRVIRCEALSPSSADGLLRAWFVTLDCIPSAIRACRGPEELGDLVIHDEESRWTPRWRSSIRYFRVYRPAHYRKVRWKGYPYEVQFAAALYGVRLEPRPRLTTLVAGRSRPLQEGDYYLIPRDGVLGYKVGWAACS
jgi:hypothetical protein